MPYFDFLFEGAPDDIKVSKLNFGRGSANYLQVQERLLWAIRHPWGEMLQDRSTLLEGLLRDATSIDDIKKLIEIGFTPEQVVALVHAQNERAALLQTGWRIKTTIVQFVTGNPNKAQNYAVVHVEVASPYGVVTDGTKQECEADFRDYLEKAETGALGRALAKQGFGTAWADAADMFDEGERVVDSPRQTTPQPTQPARPAPQPVQPAPTQPAQPVQTDPLTAEQVLVVRALVGKHGKDKVMAALRTIGFTGETFLKEGTSTQAKALIETFSTTGMSEEQRTAIRALVQKHGKDTVVAAFPSIGYTGDKFLQEGSAEQADQLIQHFAAPVNLHGIPLTELVDPNRPSESPTKEEWAEMERLIEKAGNPIANPAIIPIMQSVHPWDSGVSIRTIFTSADVAEIVRRLMELPELAA